MALLHLRGDEFRTSLADGAYHLRARITDVAANVSTIDLHSGGAGVVVVDNTAPTAAVGAPSAGSFVSGYFSTPKVREREIAEYFGRMDPSLPTQRKVGCTAAPGTATSWGPTR